MKPGTGMLMLMCCAVVAAGCLKATEPTSLPSTGLSFSAQAGGPGDRTATNLAQPQNGSFYPLEIGNRWRYRHDDVVRVIPDAGPPESFEDHGVLDAELLCNETGGDRSYVVEHSTDTFRGYSIESWVRYRQDRSGLFELDVATSTPATCAGAASRPAGAGRAALATRLIAARPGLALYRAALERLDRKRSALALAVGNGAYASQTALPGEITRLQYPLARGAQWEIRPDPRFVATVEDRETVDLPAGRFVAFRVRIDAPGVFGPQDRALFWYSRQGMLKMIAHFEGILTDDVGNVVGRVISDESRELEELSLVGGGRF